MADNLKFYLNEKDHPIIDIPENYVNKREFLRALLNVREAKPVPNEIIEKPGKLTSEEYETIKEHSAFGESLLSRSQGEIMTIAQTIAYEHHERWDGKGYPRGLKGDQISIYAQIVSVADVYDALTSKRAYKDPWPAEEARKEIIGQRGYQFSPVVVDSFIRNYDKIDRIRKLYAD